MLVLWNDTDNGFHPHEGFLSSIQPLLGLQEVNILGGLRVTVAGFPPGFGE